MAATLLRTPLFRSLLTRGLAVAFALSAGVGFAQPADQGLWVTNGQVDAIARAGNTIYIGGGFNQVGPATGSAVPLDATTGTPLGSFPKVTGFVSAVVPDGTGGWYIGGSFTAVGGFQRTNLAHVASDLSVSAWNPNANGQVHALAMNGSVLYAGGDFGAIGGQVRSRIAALNLTNGAATSWDPSSNGAVSTLAVSGSTIYAGGQFTSIGGQPRNYIAALDATTGAATAWNPNANFFVNAIAVSDSAVYAGGGFTDVGGQERNYLAALDPVTGAATAWDPDPNGFVYALALSGSTLYAGGLFINIGGQARNRIAALDATTGSATAWDPNADSIVEALAVSGSTVYAGGQFYNIGGQARGRIAALDSATGLATAWNPQANGTVSALAANGSTLYAGGYFTSVGGVTRINLAALDATTGAVTSWNPGANGYVESLAVSGSTVYVGGSFTDIGGQARNHLAAVDAATGAATAWNPNANAYVEYLAVSGSIVYAGGAFTTIGGQPRNSIAALLAGTGAATSWNPNANGAVFAIAVSESTVYAGGDFTSIGGQARNHIAALHVATGAATSWNPNADARVFAIVAGGGAVYACGNFTSIGGQPRNYIAALDASAGSATTWNANADSYVLTMVMSGTRLCAGGYFSFIGGQPHSRLALLDPSTATANAWNPNANGTVLALAAGGATVYAGGEFTSVGGRPQSYIAGIAAAPEVQAVHPASGGNSGAVTVTVAGHHLRSGAAVRLTVFGQPKISGDGVAVAADGLSLTATFNLTNSATGAADIDVINPDDQSTTLPGAFTVTGVAAPQLRVNVLGPALIRSNRRTAFDLVIDNPGNVDALAVPLWITGVPLGATVELDFALAAPPQGGGEPDWNLVPLGFTSPGGRYLPVVIPRVPPGTTVRRVFLTIPTGVPTFQLGAAVTPPWVDGSKFRACLVNGGISAPACMGAQLTAINAFLAGNPQLQALSGIGVWAKIAFNCEGASTLPAALTKAEQILDFMVQPVEVPGSALSPCGDVLPPRWRDSLLVTIVGSIDPNDKLGSRDTLSVHQAIPYSIRFENLSTATAPAQQVVISDPLDLTKFDASTVSLDVITFGNVHIVPPPGLKSYATQVDLRPARNLLVNVSAGLDPFTAVITWYFSSVDPVTGQPPTDPLAGFLPPNHVPPEGEGSVLFTVMPRSTLVSGTQVSNAAIITFDGNAPQNTGAWLNTVDNTAPGSHVLPLAANSDLPSVPVQWTATGAPRDLRDYTVYVAEDGSPYRVWRLNTTAVTDTLVPPGDHRPHHYAFYSVARDVSGNIEPSPGVADATTQARTAVGDPEPLRLSLAGARPNPAEGALSVWFTLPNREPATLEVVDVAGRRVLRRDVGALGPGQHHVTVRTAPVLRPGLYFLRLVQGSRALSTRVVVLR